MSDTTALQVVPDWDLADRMRKALRHSDLGVQEIADYIGVSRTAVSSWINGRITPSRPVLRLWAIRCGVSFEWLLGEGLRRAPISAPVKGPSRFAPRFEGVSAGQLGLAA